MIIMENQPAWLQISIAAAESQVDELSEILLELGALSITLQDAADQPVYEPAVNTTPLWQQICIIGLFNGDIQIAWLKQQLTELIDDALTYQIAPLADQEWTRVWMEDFHPMRFGQRLWICPSWEQPIDSQAINILLDPGLAFGTGTHPTTALCLEWLDGQVDLIGQTVIDYGCGSGILAVAAAKLGATTVWCVDNDPQALLATKENAVKNGVEKQLTVCLPENLPHLQVDCILANILAKPLITLAPQFGQQIKLGGFIVLSGILQEQTDDIINGYQNQFTLVEVSEKDNWMRIVAQKLTY